MSYAHFIVTKAWVLAWHVKSNSLLVRHSEPNIEHSSLKGGRGFHVNKSKKQTSLVMQQLIRSIRLIYSIRFFFLAALAVQWQQPRLLYSQPLIPALPEGSPGVLNPTGRYNISNRFRVWVSVKYPEASAEWNMSDITLTGADLGAFLCYGLLSSSIAQHSHLFRQILMLFFSDLSLHVMFCRRVLHFRATLQLS